MKELIPLKKDIIFKTKISEITSIDVEHTFKVSSGVVEGNLIIDGTYKMTEASLIEEEYHYQIPFSIAIGDNIIKESINIEISDFKYEIEKDVMKIEAELEFNCDKEDKMDEIVLDDSTLEDYFKEETKEIEVKEDKKVELEKETINNITNNIINNEEKYNTYKVHIVRQGDTIESICTKYNVKYEDIKEYNDVTEIKEKDKIIIPFINE